MRLKGNKKGFVVILLLFILLTVAFILYQSSLPPSVSGEESDRVKGFFVTLFGGEDTLLGSFFTKYVRKIAHFVEFFVLGGECAALGLVLGWRRFPLYTCPFGLLVGALDEFLQRFTGRGPSVFDVCLDFFGFVTATLLLYAAFLLRRRVGRGRKGRKENTNV